MVETHFQIPWGISGDIFGPLTFNSRQQKNQKLFCFFYIRNSGMRSSKSAYLKSITCNKYIGILFLFKYSFCHGFEKLLRNIKFIMNIENYNIIVKYVVHITYILNTLITNIADGELSHILFISNVFIISINFYILEINTRRTFV